PSRVPCWRSAKRRVRAGRPGPRGVSRGSTAQDRHRRTGALRRGPCATSRTGAWLPATKHSRPSSRWPDTRGRSWREKQDEALDAWPAPRLLDHTHDERRQRYVDIAPPVFYRSSEAQVQRDRQVLEVRRFFLRRERKVLDQRDIFLALELALQVFRGNAFRFRQRAHAFEFPLEGRFRFAWIANADVLVERLHEHVRRPLLGCE